MEVLSSTPATQRYKLRPCPMKAHEVTVFCGDTKLVEIYWIADYSTTTSQIPDRFTGGCWARRQLRNGIKYAPVASKPRISLAFVREISDTILVEFYSIADSSTAARRTSILLPGGCWAGCQLHTCIRPIPTRSITHEVTILTERDTQRYTKTSHGEALSLVPPVFSRITNSIEDYLNGQYECTIYCDPGQKAKGGPLTCFQSKS